MPPWQMWWPFTMSERTVMVSSEAPGWTRTILIPRAWAARSRENIASAVASARTCASAGLSFGSAMNIPSGKHGTLDQRRNTVTVLAVAGTEVGQHVANRGDADLVGPGQRAFRVIDAEAHGLVSAGFGADALIDGVGGFVGQHGNGAHDDQARHIEKTRNGKAGGLQQADGRGDGGRLALLGSRHGQSRSLAVIEREIDQHRIGHTGFGRTLRCAATIGHVQLGKSDLGDAAIAVRRTVVGEA